MPNSLEMDVEEVSEVPDVPDTLPEIDEEADVEGETHFNN